MMIVIRDWKMMQAWKYNVTLFWSSYVSFFLEKSISQIRGKYMQRWFEYFVRVNILQRFFLKFQKNCVKGEILKHGIGIG